MRLPKQKTPKEESDLKSFNKFMCQGKISSVLICLSNHQKGGILSLKEKTGEKAVLELLKEKHPSPGTLEEDFITEEVDTLPYHDSIFDEINSATIRKAAMRTHGSHGASGLDADEWRKILTNYGQFSIDLCKTIVQLAQRQMPRHPPYLNWRSSQTDYRQMHNQMHLKRSPNDWRCNPTMSWTKMWNSVRYTFA